MPKNKVILSLGCNLGDRRLSLTRAVKQLKTSLQKIHCSSVYVTSPVDSDPLRQQPPYYNLVISGVTPASPEGLLRLTQNVETEVSSQAVSDGFPPHEKKDQGPRYLDIDIVFFADRVIRLPDLVIPHPAYRDRLFVLIPLLEIEPQWRDPLTQETISQLIKLNEKKFLGQKWVTLGRLEN